MNKAAQQVFDSLVQDVKNNPCLLVSSVQIGMTLGDLRRYVDSAAMLSDQIPLRVRAYSKQDALELETRVVGATLAPDVQGNTMMVLEIPTILEDV